MDFDVDLEKKFEPYYINEDINGKLILYTEKSTSYSQIKVKLIGGIYKGKHDNIGADPYLETILVEKSIAPKGCLHAGENEFNFSINLSPLPGKELWSSFTGQTFCILYYLYYDFIRPFPYYDEHGRLELSVSRKSSPIKFSLNPLDLVLKPNTMAEPSNDYISIKLDKQNISQNDGISGIIRVKENIIEITKIVMSINRRECLMYGEEEIRKDYTFPEFTIVSGNPAREIDIFFIGHLPLGDFTPESSSDYFYINYTVSFKATTITNLVYSCINIPIYLYAA